MNDEAQIPGSRLAGKLIAIGFPLLIVVVTVVLGVVFSNRERKHREGRLDGAALYAKYCVACHKADGRGEGSIPSLLPFTLEPEAFQTHVAKGKGAMPGLGDKLFDSDYERLYRFIQQFDTSK